MLWVVYSFSLYWFFQFMNMIYFSVYFCHLWFPSSVFYSFLYTGLLFLSVQFSHSVVSDSLQCHELQHARPSCPSPMPGIHWTHVHQVGDGQGSLACCSPWDCKESDTTEWLNWTELKHDIHIFCWNSGMHYCPNLIFHHLFISDLFIHLIKPSHIGHMVCNHLEMYYPK